MTLSGGRPSAGITSLSGLPSTCSMTMKRWPSASPTSWMVQMCGWFSADAARASVRMRCGGIIGLVQDFYRDRALELRVVGLPHLAHPAAAQARLHIVRAEAGAGRQRHGAAGVYRAEMGPEATLW